MHNSRVLNNTFANKAEKHQIEWHEKDNLTKGKYEWYKGKKREQTIPSKQWLLGVWQPIRHDLEQYIHVSGILAHKDKHNLKSSWTQCSNIFFPFRWNARMRGILAGFLSEKLGLEVSRVETLEFEYAAPGNLSPQCLLGELGGIRGSGQTSPDVAVLFRCRDGACGIYLIENKYTETSFYDCTGAKKTQSKTHSLRGLLPNLDPDRCKHVIEVMKTPDKMCQQHAWGRKYWNLLRDTIEEKELKNCGHCPALKGGYQLFRQQALAQGLLNSRLFDHVISGVAYDVRNNNLISCLKNIGINDFTVGWTHLFNTRVKFHCFTHQELVYYTNKSLDRTAQKWVQYVTTRYDY